MVDNNYSELSKAIRKASSQSIKSETVADRAEGEALNAKHRESKTRSALTISFLGGFLFLLVFSFIFVLIYNSFAVDWILLLKNKGVENPSELIKPLELDKVLSIIIGALGTSLGFIIGYYFKEKTS